MSTDCRSELLGRILPKMMHCAPGAGTSCCLQSRRVYLLDGMTGKCLSGNINSWLKKKNWISFPSHFIQTELFNIAFY